MTEPVRLSKRVIALTQCSRREAEQYIEGGWVTVDGIVEERPQCLITEQTVVIDPQAKLSRIEPATILLHSASPAAALSEASAAQWLATAQHWQEDFSGVRPLQRHRQQLHAALPLSPDAHGLVVLSQDPRILRKLTDSQQPLEQECLVEFKGRLDDQDLARLNQGLRVHGYALPAVKVSRQSEQRLRFAFKRLQLERIAMMCRAVGIEATSIKRLRIGRQSLAKLPPGEWRYLAAYERF